MLLPRDEYRIVAIARALVDRPMGPVRPLLQMPHLVPAYLGRDARFLIDEALAIGWVEVLARAGGWRRRDGQRLWHRHRDVEMSFSQFAPALCRYLIAAGTDRREPPASALERSPETAGDRLLCFLAARLAIHGDAPELLAHPHIAGVHLVQLAFADVLGAVAPDVAPAPAPISPADRLVLDGLGDALARRLVDMERHKRGLGDLAAAAAAGRIQAAALEALDAVVAEHPPLGLFALEAAARVADEMPVYAETLGAGSIAERAGARRGAASFLRGFERWRARAEAARAVRFFEDDFDRSQELLRLWETLGDRRHARLAAAAAALEDAGMIGDQT